MYPWLPGKNPDNVTESMLKQIGETLAQFHKQSETFSSQLSRNKEFTMTGEKVSSFLDEVRGYKDVPVQHTEILEYVLKEIRATILAHFKLIGDILKKGYHLCLEASHVLSFERAPPRPSTLLVVYFYLSGVDSVYRFG